MEDGISDGSLHVYLWSAATRHRNWCPEHHWLDAQQMNKMQRVHHVGFLMCFALSLPLVGIRTGKPPGVRGHTRTHTRILTRTLTRREGTGLEGLHAGINVNDIG